MEADIQPGNEKILAKLPRFQLGTVMDMSGGKTKQIIVDQVEAAEWRLI